MGRLVKYTAEMSQEKMTTLPDGRKVKKGQVVEIDRAWLSQLLGVQADGKRDWIPQPRKSES